MDEPITPLPLTSSRPEQIFPTLTPAEIRRIATHGQRRNVRKGEILVEHCPQSITVEIGYVQIIPRSFNCLVFEGAPRIIALTNEMPLFVFDGDATWGKNETLILPDEMCGQELLAKSKDDSDILQYIGSALHAPNRTRDRQM